MTYDFNKIINRYNTNSLKYDFKEKRGMPNDVLPLWVADMDFEVIDEIKQALIEKANYGIFGYSEPTKSYFDALNGFFKRNHNWDIDTNNIVITAGVVQAISTAIIAFSSENDSILVNSPVYYPFFECIKDNKRKIISSDLIFNEKYEIDFLDLEEKIKSNNVKIYLLCNPHNPVGRVWKIDELKKISEICKKYNVLVISDEIHWDFIYKNNKHESYYNFGDKQNTIIMTSASKSFNLAGLQVSNIYIENRNLRKKFKYTLNALGYSQANIMGLVATEAAYKYGDLWLKELNEYLEKSLEFLINYINEFIPKIKVIRPEGTYLVWLDFKGFNLSDEEINEIIINKARLWLDQGNIFGNPGLKYERINIACPREILKQALDSLRNAFEEVL